MGLGKTFQSICAMWTLVTTGELIITHGPLAFRITT